MPDLDLTKPVRTKEGHRPVTIVTANGRDPYPLLGYVDDETTVQNWCRDGRFTVNGLYNVHRLDLENAPEERECWLNIYHSPNTCYQYSTREEADKKADHRMRIACVKVEYCVGQGLEQE